jgi:3-phenylpropionate/trans-cinnamate dioxygenase ferredoxin subunit
MGEFVEAAGADELKDGGMKKVSPGGKDLLLARVGDKYYAADDKCPHLGGSLSSGTLEGTVVTCPKHGSQFDLTDGHMVRWTDWTGFKQSMAKTFKSPRPIDTYEVKVEEGKVLVAIA